MTRATPKTFDLIVIGAGAAGLAAARAGCTRNTLLVELDRPGGDCTFTGCIPSKTLLETAKRVARARNQSAQGIRGNVEVDFPQVMQHVKHVVEEISGDESPERLRDEGIRFIKGSASFVGPDTIEVDGVSYSARRFVIATGSRPEMPSIQGLEEIAVLTNEDVFDLREAPRRLGVIGGGAIGCELAQAFARLGIQVLLLEGSDRLLPAEEPESSASIAAALAADGVEVVTGAQVTEVSPGIHITLDGGKEEVSHLLVATGRHADTRPLNLAAAGVEASPDGRVVVDERGRTTQRHIFAAGDCADAFTFTHVADEQGRQRSKNALGRSWRRFRGEIVPWVTFTEPEVARVGKTEAEAFERYGERARVAYLPADFSDRARCSGDAIGFVKLIAVPRPLTGSVATGRLLGATVVGPAAGETIAAVAIAMRARLLPARLAQTVQAYPTWSLSLRQAAAAWFTGADRPASAR